MRRALNSVALTIVFLILLGVVAWLIVDVIGWEIPERIVS
ncbi:MAG: hypothetical protein QOF61_2335, partial [Acidobacteriota bacterium]|nr:hypothetical protein [Acidobacteriota bacterium]